MSVPDQRGPSGRRRFTQTIRGVQAGVAYIIRNPYGRPARDIRGVEVVGHDSLMPPRIYTVDHVRGAIVFHADHPIVTVIAHAVRQPVPAIGRRSS